MNNYNLHVVNGILIADYPSALPKRDLTPLSQEVIDSMRALAAEFSHIVVTTPSSLCNNVTIGQSLLHKPDASAVLRVIHAKRRPQNNEGVIVYD